jgi:hypothetical protein
MSDKSAEPLGTREISPKVPREHWREIWHAKGKQIPGRGKLWKIYNFPSSLLYNQTEQEQEQERERKSSSLNPVAPPSIGQESILNIPCILITIKYGSGSYGFQCLRPSIGCHVQHQTTEYVALQLVQINQRYTEKVRNRNTLESQTYITFPPVRKFLASSRKWVLFLD